MKQSGTHSDKKVLDNLKKRKLTTTKKIIYFSVSKGPQFSRTIQKMETDLTVEMLQRWVHAWSEGMDLISPLT